MTSITLNVTGAKVQAAVNGPLTSGMVGIPVTIRYDDAWNGLIKNFVCRCGQWGPEKGETRTVLNIGETAAVAHEVMQANMHLYLGIEGYSADGKLVIPTTWADCGWIQHGANTGADLSTDPKLSVWAQLQAQIEQIKQESITEGEIAAAVAAYLEENPIIGSDSAQNVVIDTTLTVEGAAADAKAVGDAIAEEAQVRLGIKDALMALQYSAVKSVNGTAPDADGNVEIIISDSTQNGNQGGGLTASAQNLLMTILENAVFVNDQTINLTALRIALAESGSSSGGDTGGDSGTTGNTETLTLVQSSGFPDVTTFEYTEGAGNYVIAQRSTISGGTLTVMYDATECSGFAITFYVFDALGNPYCGTDSSHDGGGGRPTFAGAMGEIEWQEVGTLAGFGVTTDQFSIKIPDGCTFIACMRRGAGAGTAVSSVGTFIDWALNGGVSFVVSE